MAFSLWLFPFRKDYSPRVRGRWPTASFTLISALLVRLRRTELPALAKNQYPAKSGYMRAQPQRGFTLIELLIAISILGIIVVIGTAALFAYLARGRDAKRKTDLGTVKTSLESYFQDNKDKGYPTGAGGSPINCSDLGSCTDLEAKLVPTYIKTLPQDPKNSGNYVYKYSGTATSFTLTATLENSNDKDCISKPCGPDGYKIESE